MLSTKVYTPDQVAQMLQLSTNTVYDLIGKGEIVAKKIGRVYRVPLTSVSFALTGLDYDLYLAEQEDKQSLAKVEKALGQVR